MSVQLRKVVDPVRDKPSVILTILDFDDVTVRTSWPFLESTKGNIIYSMPEMLR